eukprot:m.42224 g.42224  ORF g.42224 m.42224 type:complete len:441 (-) comp9859_c0_seq3:81-1403(-)
MLSDIHMCSIMRTKQTTTITTATSTTEMTGCKNNTVQNGGYAVLVCDEGFRPDGDFIYECYGGSFLVLKYGYCSPAQIIEKVIQKNNSIYWVAIVSILGGILLGFLLVYAAWRLVQRDYRLRKNLGMHELLLQEKDMELSELINAWEISADDVTLVTRIDGESEGAFGEVWYAEWDGMGVAVKRLRSIFASENDPQSLKEFQAEVDFLRKCRHRNIVRFFGAGSMEGRPFLVTEYLELGSLNTYLRKNKDKIAKEQKSAFCLDIQAGMQYLHDVGRLHRDLKSGNVLLSKKLRAKVADFGSMRDILKNKNENVRTTRETETIEPLSMYKSMTMMIGTPMYMAPEILRQERYGPSADVWSFGIVMWEIHIGERPDLTQYTTDFNWKGPFLLRLETALTEGHRLPLDNIPKEYAELIKKCMEMSPLARPTFVELGEELQELS